MPSSSQIQIAVKDDVATVTMSDPETLNAMSIPMVEELLHALDALPRRQGARAILLTGAGRGFCSGADLSEGVTPADPDFDAGAQLDTHYAPLMRAIRDSPIPIVTAVNGPAAGFGCSIALAADIVVASESAYFLQAFRHVGLVPDGGSAYLLAHAVGRIRAMEMMLLGERVSAARAFEWGLVTRVVPAASLIDEAGGIALALAAGPTRALRDIRRQCWRATEASFDEMLALERQQQRDAGRTADHREGVAAFREKRAGIFVGA